MDNYEPILCIPRIESTIHKTFIFKKLCGLKWGFIEKITEIPLKHDPTLKRIIIKIKWNKEEEIQKIKEKIKKGEIIKLVYDQFLPWFWKIQAFIKQDENYQRTSKN